MGVLISFSNYTSELSITMEKKKKKHLIEGGLAKEGECQLSHDIIWFKCKLLLSKEIQLLIIPYFLWNTCKEKTL